jgi:hypothetical protein
VDWCWVSYRVLTGNHSAHEARRRGARRDGSAAR